MKYHVDSKLHLRDVTYCSTTLVNYKQLRLCLLLVSAMRYLQPRYLDIIKYLPDSAEETIKKLEEVLTDDCIMDILGASDSDAANKILFDYLIKDISTSKDLLDLCNLLEEITESPNLLTIIAEMRAGLCRYVYCHYPKSRLKLMYCCSTII